MAANEEGSPGSGEEVAGAGEAEPGAEVVAPETQGTAAPAEGSKQSDQEVRAEAARRWKLKFGKTERDVSEQELVALAQKSWASDSRFQQASKKEKDLLEVLRRASEDPDVLIRHTTGKDPVEVYKAKLAEYLNKQAMTPEQRELAQAKAELENYRKTEKERATKEQERQMTVLTDHYSAKYDKEMSDAITVSGLPKSPRTVKRCAELAYKNLQMGLELPWGVITDMVRAEYQDDVKELFGGMPEERLLEVFGTVAKKLNAAKMAKHGTVLDQKAKQSVSGRAKESHEPQEMNSDQFKEMISKFK